MSSMINLDIKKCAIEYGCCTDRLDDSLSSMLILLHRLTIDGTSLTLINTDVIPSNIRSIDGHPIFIEWDQEVFGSYYLYLSNYFSVETALFYRDALAQLGLDIYPALSMDRFHELGRHMKLWYLEVGLEAWHRHYFQEIELNNDVLQKKNKSTDDNEWNSYNWFFHYCLQLTLNGR